MQRMILLLVLMQCAGNVCGQYKIYYDKFFKTVSETKTPYYRTFEDLDSVTQFVEFCKDTIMAKGQIYVGDHPSMANDFVHFVKNNGNPYQFKEEFKAMRCVVDCYEDGIFSRKVVSHSGKIFYAQITSEAGDSLLTNGNGTNIRDEKGSTIHEHYTDSVLTEMYEIRDVVRDTLYYTYDKMAEPSGGYQAFMEDLVKILKYPGFARLMGKQGMVYVQFIVDKNGKLTEFKPLTNEGFNLEKKAVDRLAKMPNWNPAIFRGKRVKMKFTVPIRFRLV